jgi:hypothetical protein
MHDGKIAYCTNKNLVIRDLSNPLNTTIINQGVLNPLCCAAFSPNGDLVASGDENGALRVGSFVDGQYKEKIC